MDTLVDHYVALHQKRGDEFLREQPEGPIVREIRFLCQHCNGAGCLPDERSEQADVYLACPACIEERTGRSVGATGEFHDLRIPVRCTITCVECDKVGPYLGNFFEHAAYRVEDKPKCPEGWDAFFSSTHKRYAGLIERDMVGLCDDPECARRFAESLGIPQPEAS